MYISTPQIRGAASQAKTKQHPRLSTCSLTGFNCKNVFIHLFFSIGGVSLISGDEQSSAEDFFVGLFICTSLLEVFSHELMIFFLVTKLVLGGRLLKHHLDWSGKEVSTLGTVVVGPSTELEASL